MAFFKRIIFSLLIVSSTLATAQTPKDGVLWFDKFDQDNFKSLVKGNWFTYSDSSNGGGSSVHKNYYKDKQKKSRVLKFSYTLQQGGWKYDPYAALSCSVSAKEIPPGAQALAYEYKGKSHSCIYGTDNVKDYAFYQKRVPESTEWISVVIPFSELRQPTWGAKAKFKPEEINVLSWQVGGQSGDTGSFAVENVRFLYTPQKSTVSSSVEDISLGTIKTLYSKVLDEERTLWIYLPRDLEQMKASKAVYPVVYLLDGESNFKALAGIVSQLGTEYVHSPLPEMILVGIANTNRMRDLSPTHITKSPFRVSGLEATGGGTNFLNFMEKELIPHIDSLYPTAPYRMFIGHSLGGLMVLNTFVHRPHLFTSYLAIDPSMWWDNQLLVAQADSMLAKNPPANKKIFISIANTMYEGVDTSLVRKDTSLQAFHMRSILNFSDVLKKRQTEGVQFNCQYYAEDNHNSVAVISEYAGLRYFFNCYRIPFLGRLGNPKFTIDSAFTLHYKNISRQMGYTVLPPELMINKYGYYFLQQEKKLDKAYAFFKLNAANYPLSSNVFDSLGEYYEASGDKQKAMEAYEKALRLAETPYTRRKLEKLKSGIK